MKKVVAMIMASGTSRRMKGVNKLLIEIQGESVIRKSVKLFQVNWVDEILVVTTDPLIREEVQDLGVSFCDGGVERYHSVINGLDRLEDEDVVLIHDGARPFLDAKTLERVKEAVLKEDHFVVGVPAIDTIKVVENGLVKETPERKNLYYAQTPQGSTVKVLKEAYEKALEKGLKLTDDASALEALGIPVKMIEGSYQNKKITTREDVDHYENRSRN